MNYQFHFLLVWLEPSFVIHLLCMIEKDYLKRQIDRFFEELTALLNPKAAKEEERKHLDLLAEKYTNEPATLQKTARIIKYVDAISKDFSFRRKNNLEKIIALQN